MKKLNKKKVRWVVKQMDKREVGAYTIAGMQGITPRWAREVYRKYKSRREPEFKKPGRKPKEISKEERKLVIKTYKEFRVGATMIEQILDERGIHINHNHFCIR